MEFLSDLWLPVLLAAVAVFAVSSLIHMVIPIHKGDFAKLPQEERVLAGMREHGVKPGMYMFPCPGSMKEMGNPEMIAKYEKGPVGTMIVMPNGTPAIGKSLVQWFVFSIVVGLFVAYLASFSLAAGVAGRTVFRFAATVAFLGYAGSEITDSIWKGRSWGVTAKYLLDGLLYALATGAVFAWLWPS